MQAEREQVWAAAAPRFTWRPSQLRLLEELDGAGPDSWHIVAPPGTGKTLIGLELARRVGARTLVLAPTVAVRDQWRRSVALFGADPDRHTADQAGAGPGLTCLTYQTLGDPGRAGEQLTDAARRLWLAEMETAHPGQGMGRLAAIESADPDRARRDIARHVRALRRSLGTGDGVGLPYRELIGERTEALVEKLAGDGIGCVVLDECHHLLDWWALAVSALLERMRADRPVAVIGLTATPPDPQSGAEERNYRGLLGDVDAELHLPAVVAEGGVAPWRDGVHLTTLTDAEAEFLDGWAGSFAAELDGWLAADQFVGWAVAAVAGPALDARAAAAPPAGAGAGWNSFWDRDPLLGAALSRWWTVRGLALPAGFEPPPGAAGGLDLDDRLLLLDAWLRSPDGGPGRDTRAEVEKLTARHGVAMTSAGPRWGRSVADLICARSAAKGTAAARVLAAEAARRGDGLRALVAVERDTAATPPAEARRVLGEDPGTAAQILGALCRDPDAVALGVVAVTARGMWADAAGAGRYCAAINVAAGPSGRWVETEGCDVPNAVRMAGRGAAWTSAHWLAAATTAMDDGGARVLVATRGLVGEGWDHPPLNVLIDLAEDASPASTTQLRGRALRVDPADPGKVASLWDVAVVHPAAHGDWHRLRRRHQHWWGPAPQGQVVTGPAKLHPALAGPAAPSPEEMAQINAASAEVVADIGATAAAWARVAAGGVGTSVVHVPRHRLRRQVRTRVPTWRRRTRAGSGLGLSGAAAVVAGAALALVSVDAAAVLIGAGTVTGGSGVALGRTGRPRSGEATRTLEALGAAVLAGLRAAGVAGLDAASVSVTSDGAEASVAVTGAGERAATSWADSLAEALGPLGSPRWMIAVGAGADAATWRVPAEVGATREAAEAYCAAFSDRVPGARLIRAGTPEATELVLADARRRPAELGRSLLWYGRPTSHPGRGGVRVRSLSALPRSGGTIHV